MERPFGIPMGIPTPTAGLTTSDDDEAEHRRTQDFTMEGVHRGGSRIFQKGSSQGDHVPQKLK